MIGAVAFAVAMSMPKELHIDINRQETQKRLIVDDLRSKVAVETAELEGVTTAVASIDDAIEKISVEVDNLKSNFVQIAAAAPNSGGNSYAFGWCTYWVKNKRPDLPNFMGNANMWYASAQSWGFKTGAAPKVGAVAQTTSGWAGHVAYVEKMSPDRSMVYVSEMAAPTVGAVSYSWYPASNFNYIYNL